METARRKYRALRSARDRGATAVEYGLMAGLIAAVIVATVSVFGEAVYSLFNGAVGRF